MKTSYTRDHGSRYSMLHLEGVITDEFLEDVRRRFALPDREGVEHRLLDLRDVESWEARTETFRALVEDRFRTSRAELRLAVLARGDVTFGMFRMAQGWVGDTGGRIEIFRDLEEALSWLFGECALARVEG